MRQVTQAEYETALAASAAYKAFAAPYVQGLWTKNNPVYVTGGREVRHKMFMRA